MQQQTGAPTMIQYAEWSTRRLTTSIRLLFGGEAWPEGSGHFQQETSDCLVSYSPEPMGADHTTPRTPAGR